MYTGPNIERDGLVFGYDTGEFSENNSNHETFKPFNSNNRFFKGAASRNYIAGQNAVAKFPIEPLVYTTSGTFQSRHPNDIKAYDINGNRVQTYVNTGVGDWSNTDHAHWQHDPILNKPVVVMYDLTGSWKAKSFGTGLGSWNSLGLTHGSKYTISWLQWVDNLSKNAKAGLYTKNTSGGNGFHDGQANSASAYNTKLMTWQRVYQTYTTSSVRDLNQTLASIYMYGHYNVRATVKIADVQIDLHDHPTSYQEFIGSTTERSSTEGLLDLVGNTTIDTSNVSFNNHGFPSFDGTDDDIDLGSDITFKTSGGWSVVSVAKYNSVAGSYNNVTSPANFIGSDSISYNSWYWSVLSNRLALWNISPGVWKYGSTTLQQDTWYHVTIVCSDDGTSYQMYLNGVAEGGDHTTYSWNPSYSGLKIRYIGRGNTGNRRLVNGSIPITKVYDRVLTPEEVKQNYNSYKNRFDI